MRIVTISDIHAEFDRFAPEAAPSGDLCLMAGDLTNIGCGMRAAHLANRDAVRDLLRAEKWLSAMAARMPVCWIPGNHDIKVGPSTFAPVPNVHYIEHKLAEFGGLKIVGVSISQCYDLPVLAEIWDWSTVDPAEEDAAYDSLSPADIIVSHNPPHGTMDGAFNPEVNEIRSIGSRALLRYIGRHHPKLVVSGHAHDNIGIEWLGKTAVVNTSQCWGVFDTDARTWTPA